MNEVEPVAAYDISADAFPFTVEYLNPETREVLAADTIERPGVLRVRGIELWGMPVAVRCTFANGEIHTSEPGDE